MRSKIWLSGLMLLMCGCTGMNNTQQGAVTGGLLGGGLGLLLGGRHPGVAAAVGAGGGALIGGAIGADKDRQDQARTNAAVAAANAQAQRQMSLDEIVQLVQRNTSDDIIIQQISATGSVFSLTTADITYLQDQRVSSRVIQYMQAARRYVVQPRPVVIYERPPPPPFGVGVVIGR